MNYAEIASGMADLVTKKEAAYGSSFAKSEAVFKLLYPQGVKPDQIGDLLFLVRVFDKMSRIATANDPFGEDPAADILGYALLQVRRNLPKVSTE